MTPRRSVQGGACQWPDSGGCALSKLDCDDPTNFRSIRQINLFSNHGSRCRWQQAVRGNELGKCSNDDDGVLTTPTQCATDVGSCPNGSSWDPEPECTVETTSFGRCTNSTGDPGMCAWSHEHCSHEDNDNDNDSDNDNNNNNTNTNTTLWLPFEEGCTCDQVQVGGCSLLRDNGELQLFCAVSEDACDDEQSWIKPREVKTAAGYDCFLCREVRTHEVPADSPGTFTGIDTDDLINSTTTTTTVPPIFSESQNAPTISAVGGITTIIISLILGAILALVIVGLVLWRVFRTKRDIKRAVEGEKEIPPPATAIEIDSTIMMDNASVLSDDDYDYEVAPSISTSSRASGKVSQWRTMSQAIRAKMRNSEDAATPTIAYENVKDKSSPEEEPHKPAEAEATNNVEASSVPAEMEHPDIMPEGWSEAIDPNSQQVYYYNSISRETAWERPTKAEPPAMEEPESAVEQTTTEVGPPEEEPTSPAAAAPAPEEEATTEVPPSAEEEISSLPEGWVEATDPSTQQVCYYNSISEETAWERPTMEESPAAEEQISKRSDEPEIAIEQTAAEESESSTEAASTSPAENEVPIMPEGWEEVTDPATTQQVYYYNVLSGETAWERPLVPSASTADSAPDKETNDNDATPEIVVDENE